MIRAASLFRNAAACTRAAVVIGCGIALVLAGQALPL